MKFLKGVVYAGVAVAAAGVLAPAQDAHVILDGSSYAGFVSVRTRVKVTRSNLNWPAEFQGDEGKSLRILNTVTGATRAATAAFEGGGMDFAATGVGSFSTAVQESPGRPRHYDYVVPEGDFLDQAVGLVTGTVPALGTSEAVTVETIHGVGSVRGDWLLTRLLVRHRFHYTGRAPYGLLPKNVGRTRLYTARSSVSGVLFNDGEGGGNE